MKINRKLLLLLLILTVCLLSTNFIYRQFIFGKVDLLFQERYNEEKGDIKNAQSISRSLLDGYMLSFSLWDQMVDFAASPDTNWARKNIAGNLSTNHVDAVWVYNKAGQRVYYTNLGGGPDSMKKLMDEPGRSPADIHRHGDEAAFFMQTPSGYYEVEAASILHSSDTLHNRPPEGYLYAARLIDQRYLQRMDELSGDQVTIETGDAPVTEQLILRTDSQFVFRKGFTDLNGKVIGNFRVVASTRAISNLISSYIVVQNYSVAVWVFLLLLMAALVLYWISRPLHLISQSLESNQEHFIIPYLESPSEFGKIARLIQNFMLQQQELLDAKNLYEEESRAKSEFLALISHELRTPLQSIIGMGDLARQSQLNEVQGEYISIIQSNSSLLLSLINEVLDYSRLNSNEIHIRTEPLRFDEMMDDLIDTFSFQVNEKNIGLYYYYEPEVPSQFISDPLRLKQVIVNLMNNAVKFTEEGNIHLHVSSLHRDAEKIELLFEVSDTGQGIPLADQKKIFQPFFQAEQFSRRKKSGTGLGLAISQRLVQLMQGQISFESTPGVGSTFRFTIQAGLLPGGEQAERKLHHPVRPLLLVKKEALMLNLEKLFAVWKQDFIRCATEEELLQQVSQGTPSLVIYGLCDPAGARRISTLLSGGNRHGTHRLLVLPSGQLNEFLKLSVERVIDDFVSVPLRHADLFRKVDQLLKGNLPNHEQRRAMTTEPIAEPITISILVVEDHKLNQQMLQHFFQKINAQADFVDSGQAAIDILRKKHFELVLMDVSMPGMDGITATRLIMGDALIPQKPVIVALTAHAFEEDKQRCFDAGMQDFMTKPVTLDVFTQIIRKWNDLLKKNH